MRSTPRIAVLFVAAVVAAPVGAQTARQSSGGGDKRAMQQLQQLAEQRTQLEAENSRLKRELDEVKARLTAAERGGKESGGRVARAQAEAAEAKAAELREKEAGQQLRARTDELVARFRQTADTLKQVESDRSRLDGELRSALAERQRLQAANAELYAIATETLDRYEHGATWRALGRAEPFTGLVRTRLENYADEYRARAAELRAKPAAAPAAAASPGSADPPR